MSNVGKTHWSKLLESELGFTRFDCDGMIEQNLEPYLKKHGFSGINDVSKWMGQPYDKRYPRNSEKYLFFEIEIMKKILNKLEKKQNTEENIVIDTTGSVVYTGAQIMEKLKKISIVINLGVPDSVKDEMLKKYIENPRPVYWGSSFNKTNTEENMDALKRCYPSLLSFRSKKYKEYADIILDYFRLRDPLFNINDFVKAVKK